MIKKFIILIMPLLTISSCGSTSGNESIDNLNSSSVFHDEQTSESSQSNLEDEDYLYCTLPSKFEMDNFIYISDGMITDSKLSLNKIIGFLMNDKDDVSSHDDNLFYVVCNFETSYGATSLPIYSLNEYEKNKKIVVETQLYDFIYTEERSYLGYES